MSISAACTLLEFYRALFWARESREPRGLEDPLSTSLRQGEGLFPGGPRSRPAWWTCPRIAAEHT
jgi:hypothetical protein